MGWGEKKDVKEQETLQQKKKKKRKRKKPSRAKRDVRNDPFNFAFLFSIPLLPTFKDNMSITIGIC